MKNAEGMNYKDYYASRLGFTPYSYQNKVAELLLSGKNIILSVPTGAGKTWASIMPFLYAKEKQINFPSKLIYSLPLRTLTNSICEDVKNIVGEYSISIQTGEFSNDPFFESDIVFSTIDQTLSSFLCFPLSLSHRQANINAGALVGSYLVFDEFHLLDPRLSMSTTLGMLRMLKNMCRVCIMTATLSDSFLHFLKTEFDPQNQYNFEIVTLADFPEDRECIKSIKPVEGKEGKKSVFACDGTITVEAILEKHKNRTIVICNRVENAQNLFEELKSKKKKESKLLCIHSRYFDSDRKKKEKLLKEYFGKNSNEKDVILVATQVIEAGMDISCDVMHTEISPINSFLQRAGRCARFENEYGDIYVYDVLNRNEKDIISESEKDEKDNIEIRRLNNKYLPYDKELCQLTLEELKNICFLDDKISGTLVNSILTNRETLMIEAMSANIFNVDKIKAAWHDCDKKNYGTTIRDIQSVDLVLGNFEDFEGERISPWEYETISVYRWSFISWIKKIIEHKQSECDWIIAKAEQSCNSQFDFDWTDDTNYYLKKLEVDEINNYYDTVFINNKYFDYSSGAGLVINQNTNNCISPRKEALRHANEILDYKKDTFYEHCKGLIKCFEKDFLPDLKFVFNNLDDFWGEAFDWEKLIKIMMCYHDFGKLNKSWQAPMLEYQRKKTGDKNYFEVLAHSDYNELLDKELGKECGIDRKPPHAGIGAMRMYDIIFDKFYENEELARAISNAILKHHSVDNRSYCGFEIKSQVLNELNILLAELLFDKEPIKNIKERGGNNYECEKVKEWILYFIMARLLRLCDQRATKNLEKYYAV